ncbi:HWE histidine kinase domain-containing protein [Aurantimonas marianensis]|uniref:histidine kinase n=1 Tax=Aurantimonas marianensis TaxID=2920428 RepID=A0A9X2H4I6_9HYPH|nr:HWE histidine kinase domain-containing protein [Aurantimonas marianensis]MCP3053728.1 GAF domain-containing protein [Aurantimonas marianensis]
MSIDAAVPFQVDLSNCDREPIHLLGRIQEFGFLIAVTSDWLIRHVSANIGDFVGKSADELLGSPIATILPTSTVHAVRGRLQVLSNNDGSERLFAIDVFENGQYFDIAIHLSGDSTVLEMEPASARRSADSGALVKAMILRIQKAPDLETLYRECVRQLRAVTGFDRVMLYRFHGDGAGAVIAESVRGGYETFLGLNYPASDIPQQARALYIRNQIRIIANVDAEPVPIMPALSPDGKPLDLSLSLLRAVSPIHVEYLKNMGVSASMSISIVIDGKLWGLFALHHYAARHLPMELRSAIELFGQMASFVIEGRIHKERRAADETARDLHDRYIGKLVATTPSVAALADHADELRDFIACDGFAAWTDDEARTFGQCPNQQEIAQLARFLNRASASKVYASDRLSEAYPDAAAFHDRAAGMLAIPLSRIPRDYLMFFRKEIVQTVSWAGDPTKKQTVTGPNGPRLTPRESFEVWKETVVGRSYGWTEAEMKRAEALRVSLLEVLLHFNEENERTRDLAAQHQEFVIAELNHRVRNILSLIRALVGQSQAGASSVDEFGGILGGRIQALARAHDQITRQTYVAQSLGDIIRTELQAYVGRNAGGVHLDGPDVFIEANAFSTLALVFHEMVTNSAKYGALADTKGVIHVDWTIAADGSCDISWQESDGPPVTPPSRRGFGSTIIERAIPHDLGGEAEVNYPKSGLIARFLLPASAFYLDSGDQKRPNAQMQPVDTAATNDPVTLTGLRGLIVEDSVIIALDTEQLLLDNGMERVFTAANLAEARQIIESEPFDVALLDVNLGTETSFSLIGPLNRKNVPFVFVTGYGERLNLPEDNPPEVEAIRKPFAGHEVVEAIARAAARRKGER